ATDSPPPQASAASHFLIAPQALRMEKVSELLDRRQLLKSIRRNGGPKMFHKVSAKAVGGKWWGVGGHRLR
ncbi:uncharacterized protein AB675_7420, partial [Cyphellophora attinorum]